MTKFVVDAYAWIEYLNGSNRGKKVSDILENNSNEILTSSATVAEVVSKFLRSNKDHNIAVNAINSLSKTVDVSQDVSLIAGKIHFEAKKRNKEFGMLDAFVAATARKAKARILTGDDDFKNFKESVFI